MKAYTDIEQSKKLAEILPIESADMRYGYIAPYECSDRMYDGGYDKVPYPKDFMKKNANFSENEYDSELPCWSLAALMNIIEIEKVEICFNCNNNKYCWVDVHFESLGSFCQDHELYDSKIDALIAIIKKLKNRNLL